MTTPSFLLQNAKINGVIQDIFVHQGIIQAIGSCDSFEIPQGMDTITKYDAKGCLLFPGFYDAHTHMRDPGYEYKEDIITGLTAAAYGGFGGVMAMANTCPVNDTAATTLYMCEKAKKHWPNGPHLYPVGALTIGLEGKELSPLGELAEAGCVAFSNDGKPVGNTELFRRAIEYASVWGKLVIDHCEDPYLAAGSHMNEGIVSGKIGIKGQSTVAEALHVARDILLAEYLNLPVHLAHISCRQSVELIAWAKAKGVKVTAETCPHYLILDETSLEGYNTLAKVCPPLRTQEDIIALRSAVADGTIDMFVTDHAPHATHEKEHTLDEVPNGLIGLETAVPLTYDLVRQGILTEENFVRMWHDAPAKIFNLPDNSIKQGNRANFFIFDPSCSWQVTAKFLHSKSCNTPFLEKIMQGKVLQHWGNGVALLENIDN